MTSPAPRPTDTPVPGARHALTLLVLINLFNYIDRQVLAAVGPEIAETFFEKGDPNTGKLMGALPFAFLVTYMLAAPIFGWMATWMSRWLLIGAGVIIWSLASGASGLAHTYLLMFLTRCLVGIGEAVYGPVAPDVISDLYPVKKRGQVLAWFYAAIPFGGALGYALGDIVTKQTGDWRWAFYVVVPPGLALGVWCFFLREPPRGQSGEARKQKLSDYFFLLRTPSFAFNTIGMTFMTFAMGGLAYWMPDYLLEEKVPDVPGLGWVGSPKTFFGALTALTGLAATLIGGLVGDRLRARYPGSYFLVSGAAMVISFPLLLLTLNLPFPLAWVPLAGFVFCLFFNTGPTNTILANVTHPHLRAPGFALNILIIHLLGDAISPFVMGWIKDASNIKDAFYAVSAAVLLGGLVWLWGARYLEEDTRLAPTRLPAS